MGEAQHICAKVRKLLALGTSPNWHEADRALEKASEHIYLSKLEQTAPDDWQDLAESLTAALGKHYARPDAPAGSAPENQAPAQTDLHAEAALQIEALAGMFRQLEVESDARVSRSNSEAIVLNMGALMLTIIKETLNVMRPGTECDARIGFEAVKQLHEVLTEHCAPAFATKLSAYIYEQGQQG